MKEGPLKGHCFTILSFNDGRMHTVTHGTPYFLSKIGSKLVLAQCMRPLHLAVRISFRGADPLDARTEKTVNTNTHGEVMEKNSTAQ